MAKVIITIEDVAKEDSVIASAEVLGDDKETSHAVEIAAMMLRGMNEALPDEAIKEISDEEFAALQSTPPLDS